MNFRLESLELKANPNFWQILGREKLFSLILPICNRECLCHRSRVSSSSATFGNVPKPTIGV
jgi:hypothetical protein